jgi:hypothetical protein
VGVPARADAGLGIHGEAAPALAPDVDHLHRLQAVRPDYHLYIGGMRPMETTGPQPFYMALVRPGATDPALRASAPLAGPGARNDVLYDRARIGAGRSAAWSLLLLDHEYFHARHLAGATSLPLPRMVAPQAERHFYEAAAWGWNIAEARAGRYPGLRPEEFREALDRYGEHYAALRDLLRGRDAAWDAVSILLRRPASLVTTPGAWRPGAPARPSGPGRSPATP